ncbi:MAG TPA: hypothetical protein VFM18_00750 [Methanosarcina sp.]|nr:hypothetical protein [Methanosarcina sp.]
MKYVEYALILAWHVLSKSIGVFWFFVVVPFRRYARNTVYNYVLENNIYLKRLEERPMLWDSYLSKYIIAPWHGADGGYINYRKVSKLEYILVYWLIYGWLDDDANDDTFDIGRVEELRKESKVWAFFLRGAKRNQYGNSFDLGDAIVKNFHFFASMFWNNRNTAQNFLYMQFQKKYQPFLHIIAGRQFGWGAAPDGVGYQLYYGQKV